MFKFVVLCALVACSMAAPAPKPGFLAAPAAYHVEAAPVALAHSVPVATSYANTYKVSYKSPVVAAAPVYTTYAAQAAPVAYAAHAAPIAYAAHASPLTYTAPLAYAAHAAPVAYTSYVH